MSIVPELEERLLAAASINDPYVGEVVPTDMQKLSELWPGHDKWARVELSKVTDVPPRRIEEYVYFDESDAIGLPVVFVFDDSGEETEVRVYSDHHLVADRAPLLPTIEGLKPRLGEEDVLSAYFAALPDPDPESSVRLFEADGYIQHSNGDRFTGRAELMEDFTNMKRDNGGGINIRYAMVGDDGTTLVLECLMPSGRPAVAIYERSHAHLVRAVRISL